MVIFQKAYTLIEVIVVIIIIGILATIAMPRFFRAVEATRAKEAVAALQQIRSGERIYRMEENTYWPAGSSETDVAIINATLNLFLDTREVNWDYYITAPDADNFTATAQRQGGGMYGGTTITLDEAGPPFGGTWPLPLP